MSFLDDVGKFFSGDWDQVGLDSSFDQTVVHEPAFATPPTPLGDVDIKAWNLLHADSFDKDGITVMADGSLKKKQGFDFSTMPGAYHSDTSVGAQLLDAVGLRTVPVINGNGTTRTPGKWFGTLDGTTVAIGVGALILLVLVVKR